MATFIIFLAVRKVREMVKAMRQSAQELEGVGEFTLKELEELPSPRSWALGSQGLDRAYRRRRRDDDEHVLYDGSGESDTSDSEAESE